MNRIMESSLQRMRWFFEASTILVLVSVITALLLFTAPAQAITLNYDSNLYQGKLGSPVSFSLTANILNQELVWLRSINARIYNVAQPSNYVVYLNNLPYNSTTVSYSSADTQGGPVDVALIVTSAGGSVNAAYDFIWTPPTSWPEGSYKMKAFISGSTSNVEIPVEISFALSAPKVSQPPVLECMWETPDDGDSAHNLPGAQVLPTQKYEVDKQISLFTVVSDADGINTITGVNAAISYPAGLPRNGAAKSQSALTLLDKQSGITAIQTAYSQGLVTFSSGQNFTTILNQLNNNEAAVFTQSAALHYNDPAGDYTVSAFAVDTNGKSGNTLSNYLNYVPVTAFQIDFSSLKYGSVQVGETGYIKGDDDMSTPMNPTIRNIGNTNLRLIIRQDEMGFGSANGISRINYEAYLGYGGTPISFLPRDNAVFPNILPLSGTISVNFALHINQVASIQSSQYSGSMSLSAEYAPFN